MIKYKYLLLSMFLPVLAVALLLSLDRGMGTAIAAPSGTPICEVETNGDTTTDFFSADSTALQAAVTAVAAGTHIKVAGTCAGVQTQAGVTQTVYINKSITIQGGFTSTNWLAPSNPAGFPTILDAQQGGRVVYITAGIKNVSLDGLTITGGNGAGGNGGGIFAGANLTWRLFNSIVSANTSTLLGGGIYNTAVLFTMDNSTLIDNTSSSFGGGLHTTGAVIADITNSLVDNNTAQIGGGLHLDNGGTLRVDTTIIQNNHANTNGGGAANDTNTGTLIITNSTIGRNTADDSGAGLFNNGTLTVDNTTVMDNEAVDDGGGLLNHTNGRATITNSVIENNRAESAAIQSSRGAGIYNRLNGIVTVITTTLQANTAESNGGGIWNEGTFTLQSSSLLSNTSAIDGGGIWNAGNLTITSSDILSNRVPLDGGGLHNTGDTTINDSTLAYNEANDGGGIYSTGLVTTTTVSISGSTIHDNQAAGTGVNRGGGVYVNSGPLSIVNSTLSQNSAEDEGAALVNNGNVDLTHTTIVSNTSIFGPVSGIYNLSAAAVINLTNSAVAYNTDLISGNTDCGGVAGSTVVDNGYNLVANGACITAGTSLSGNPLLGSLANNGGSTLTHLPLPFSPVIDRIPAPDCAAADDQIGVARPVDGACDIGSVELALNYSPPVATADEYTTTEDVALTVITAAGVLANDLDPDFGPLTAVLDTNVVSGTLILNADGSFSYTPDPNICGSDSFTYHANDGQVNSAIVTVTLNVTCVPDLPIAANDTYTTLQDTPLTVVAPGVLSNDSDGDGDPLTAVLDADVLTGTLVLNADGSFDYTPPAGVSGIFTFTYHVDAGGDSSNIAVVSLLVGDVNDPPVAVNDSYTTNEDTALNVAAPGVLSNDSDADGDPLTAVLVADVVTGTLTLNSDGSFDYTPSADWFGVTTFTYRANDGLFNSNTATVTITVTAVNDAPIAAADSYTTTEDVSLAVSAPGVLGNDSDIEGSALTAVLDTDVTNGTLTLNSNGSFNYTPDPNICGSDSFTYHANDGQADSAAVTVTLTVTCVFDAPVAVDDSYATAQDTQLTVAAPGILGNDSDADGDSLTAVLDSGVLTGTLVFNPDGSFTYTPLVSWSGVTTFTYHANDGALNSNIAVVTISVGGANNPPVAGNDSYPATEDTLLAITAPGVLGNDSDADGHSLTAVLDSGTSSGSLNLSGNGSFTYTPAANFCGTDSFTYHANDGLADSNIATVTITVTCVNDAPVALNDSYTVLGDSSNNTLAILANDNDADGDPLSISAVSTPANGTAVISGPTLLYTPDPGFAGTDTLTYTVSDGLLTDTATVTITVLPAGDVTVYLSFIVVDP